MTGKTASRTATLLAAVGLSALSPAQTGAALLVAATALWASPALAQQQTIPGVGIVIKKKPGNAPILVPSDANGEVRLTGLEPGDYEVQPILICCPPAIKPRPKLSIRVGQDGRLALVAKEEKLSPAPNERSSGPRVRHYVEAIPFDGSGIDVESRRVITEWSAATGKDLKSRAKAVTFDMQQVFRTNMPPPCDPIRGQPDTCNRMPQRGHIDVNASSAAEIIRLAPETSPAAAEALIAERTRGGAFKNVQDFASRVCTKTSVDFGDVPVRMGNASILVNRGDNPKAPGFKCAAGKDGGAPDVSIINILLTTWLIWYVSSL